RRIDRHPQPRPEVDQRAEMVLMRVGQHDAEEIASFLDQKANVRKDKIDAGELLAGKGDANVDRDPLALTLGAEPVESEIHADLADPTQWRKDQFVAGLRHQRPPPIDPGPASSTTSPAAIDWRPPSGSDSTRRPVSSTSSKRPTNSWSASRTRIRSPRPAARASQSARM